MKHAPLARFVTGCAVGFATAAAVCAVSAQPIDWATDLDALAKNLPEVHADWFHDLDPDDWEDAVEDLRGRIEGLPDEVALFELSALCALAGDAHTGIDLRSAGVTMHAIPLGVEAFEDGLFVVAAGVMHALTLEHELVAVNGVPADELIERLGRLVATDNEGSTRRKASQLLTIRGALRAAGVVDGAAKEVELTLRPMKSETTIEHRAMFVDASVIRMMPMRRAPDFNIRPIPTYLKRATGNYQSDYDEASKTLYVAYNVCRESDGLRMDRFTDLVLGFWDRLEPERLLIDLRHNSGGDERVLGPFIDAIERHEEINRPGRLFVAIGPRTFSSAMNNAVSLDERTEAVLVGEPTGGKPNHFGEVNRFELPSGIAVFYSTKYFERVAGDPDAVHPDLDAAMTSGHWFAARDPVFEAVVGYPAP